MYVLNTGYKNTPHLDIVQAFLGPLYNNPIDIKTRSSENTQFNHLIKRPKTLMSPGGSYNRSALYDHLLMLKMHDAIKAISNTNYSIPLSPSLRSTISLHHVDTSCEKPIL